MPNTQLSEKAATVLFENGRDFIDHALTIMFEENPTYLNTKFSVVNIQMALELFIKFRLASVYGIQSICKKDLSKLPTPEDDIMGGRVPTKSYNECKDAFIAYKGLGNYEQELLQTFQDTRNAIVHFGKTIDANEFKILSGHVVAKVFRRILEDEADPWLHRYLKGENYRKLISFAPYVAEAVDDANDHGDEVLPCFECGNDTLAVIGEEYYCFCCGFIIYGPHAPYITCPFCKEKAMVYDALNEEDGIHRGKCIKCQEDTLITFCAICDTILLPEVERVGDSMPWVCVDCHLDKQSADESDSRR